MTLQEMGQQYLEQSKVLYDRIAELRKESSHLSGNEAIIMKRRILSLYEDAALCRQTANKLLYYYNK